MEFLLVSVRYLVHLIVQSHACEWPMKVKASNPHFDNTIFEVSFWPYRSFTLLQIKAEKKL